MLIRHLSRSVLASLLLIASGCASLEKTIRDLGYKPVALPSTAYRPGKVVMIENEDPFQAITVCEFGSYIGSASGAKAEAASVQVTQKLSGTFSLGADYLNQINAKIGSQYVREVSVTLNNVTVEEISDDRVFEGHKLQQPGCTQALENIRDRSRLGFLQNALKADAVYKVTFDTKIGINAEAQHRALRDLALKIGASPESVSKDEIRGANLYWGVKPPRIDLVRVVKQESPTPPPLSVQQPSDEKKSPIQTIPPEVSQAKRKLLVVSLNQLVRKSELVDVSTSVPGYFEFTAPPSSGPYSFSCADTESYFGVNYFASVRIAGLSGADVLELKGLGVWFAIDASVGWYYMYESEENWTTWRPLTVARGRDINTLAIYQIGREVSGFLNGNYVATLRKLKKPGLGPVGVCFKANPKTGGRIHFQKLSIWELRD